MASAWGGGVVRPPPAPHPCIRPCTGTVPIGRTPHVALVISVWTCGSKHIQFGSGSGVTGNFQFWKNKFKIILGKKCYLKSVGTGILLKKIITNCHQIKFLLSWVSKLWIFILNLTSFAFIVFRYYIYMYGFRSIFWIRIQIAPEYGSNTDPDPQHFAIEASWGELQYCLRDELCTLYLPALVTPFWSTSTLPL